MKKRLPQSAALTAAEPDAHRCQFSFTDGRLCRMPRWEKHTSLCVFHAKEEQRLLAVDRAGRELASLSGDFKTVDDINHVLGKLFSLLAQNRIHRRDAVALAYICQLLLRTIPEEAPHETAKATLIWDIFDKPGRTSKDLLPALQPKPSETDNAAQGSSSL